MKKSEITLETGNEKSVEQYLRFSLHIKIIERNFSFEST